MNDQLERDLRTVLGDIIAQAPQALQQPDRLTVVEIPVHHRRPALAIALGVTVLAVVAGLVALSSRTTEPTQVPPTDAPATSTPQPSPVVGTATCGTELPVNITVPNAVIGPINGAAPLASQPAAEGQYVQYWTVSGGVVEIRWPADAQPLYGTGPVGSDTDSYGGGASAVAQDGSEIDAKDPEIDPASQEIDTYTFVMTRKPDVTLVEPCERVEIRTIRLDGSQNAGSFDARDLSQPTVDVNPLIRSTQDVTTAPAVDNSAPCSEPAVTSADPAATPAEALARFLSQGTPGVPELSGYDEYHVMTDDSYVYQHSSGGTLSSTITVTRVDSAWRTTACMLHVLTAEEQQAQLQHLLEMANATAITTLP